MSASNASNQPVPESASFRYASTPQRRMRGLSSSLLVTLDLGSLVKGFASEVRERVSCEGVEYIYAERGILIRDGESCRHRCRYTLRIRDEVMGQMLFTRGHRFMKEDLAALELLLVELMPPLRRALLHRGVIERRRGSEEGAGVRSPAPLDSMAEVAAPPRQQPASVPKTSDMNLVPLGGQGDYSSELLESEPRKSGPSPYLWGPNSMFNDAQRDTEPPRQQPASVSKASDMNLVPLGGVGDHPSELVEVEPRKSGYSPYLWGPDSMFASAQRDSDFERGYNRDRTVHARLAELITRSGIDEEALYKRAREVLGYAVYSDEALRIMEKFASAA